MNCVVWGCSNGNPATADPSVHYYVFPKHPIFAQQWITASGWPPEEVDINIARICSIHFSENSYTTEVKLIDYITCYTKVLKYDAIPTLYLPLTTQIIIKEADPQEFRDMIIFPSTAQEKKEYAELKVQVTATPKLEKYKHVKTKAQLSVLENCNKGIREKVVKLEGNVKRLRETLAKQIETYKVRDLELSAHHQELLRSKQSSLSLPEQKMLLTKVFSESQIKILSGKKKIYWSNDDMAVGYTIRHLSNKRCYMYLTKKLNIPLPAVSSIKRWMTMKNVGKKSLTIGSPKKTEGDDDDTN